MWQINIKHWAQISVGVVTHHSFPHTWCNKKKKRCLYFLSQGCGKTSRMTLRSNRVDIFLLRVHRRGDVPRSSPLSKLVWHFADQLSLRVDPCCISHMQASTLLLVMTRANTTFWKFNDSVKEVKARHLHKWGPKATPTKPGPLVQMLLGVWRCVFLPWVQAGRGMEVGALCSVGGRWNIPLNTQELLAGMC